MSRTEVKKMKHKKVQPEPKLKTAQHTCRTHTLPIALYGFAQLSRGKCINGLSYNPETGNHVNSYLISITFA